MTLTIFLLAYYNNNNNNDNNNNHDCHQNQGTDTQICFYSEPGNLLKKYSLLYIDVPMS